MAVRNFTHGQLTIVDGAGRRLIVVLDEGNLTFTERKESKIIMSRGKVKEHAEGVEEAIPVAWQTHFTDYFSLDRNGTLVNSVSVRDFLKGDYNGAVSVSDCGPFQTNLEFFIKSPCKSGVGDKDETLPFNKFHLDETGFSEEEESNKLAFSGKSLSVIPGDNVPQRNPV